jgi:hypothetical protein
MKPTAKHFTEKTGNGGGHGGELPVRGSGWWWTALGSERRRVVRGFGDVADSRTFRIGEYFIAAAGAWRRSYASRMLLAVEQVKRMRGGAQAQLMRCSNGGYYVVKFQNNPQGRRILANELLGTRLARRIGLPSPEPEVIEVREDLIAHTDELVIRLGRGRALCSAGKQFGSRYPGEPAKTVVYDFLPDEQLREVANLGDFCGVLVFDKWTCNTNGRQAIFFRDRDEERYRAQMIDHGFCFNACEWNFPDAPLRGLYARHRVYEQVRGEDAFEPWIARVERISESDLDSDHNAIPPEWFEGDFDAIERMLAQLVRRKKLVRELVVSAWKSIAQPFPNWR